MERILNTIKIKSVHAREIIDCRGFPTLEVEVSTDNGYVGRAAVPAGKSTGTHEAFEMRDGDRRFRGLGVLKAVSNVNQVIGPALVGKDVTRQREIDLMMIQELDGTPNKSKLGANAIVGVSLAIAKAAAKASGLPLYLYLNANAHIIPVPLFNLINGGKHASGDLEIQEFCIFPIGAENITHALQIAVEINIELGNLLLKRYGKYAINVGDEGGYVPPLKGIEQPLDVLVEAVGRAGYEDLVVYGLDCAATHFFDRKTNLYNLGGNKYDREGMIDLYKQICKKYKVFSIEDALHEDDFEGWALLTSELDIQLIGDDLFTTNLTRLKRGVNHKSANALLLKVNQIGTLSEALDVAELAFRSGYSIQVSERSGETEDNFIADLAVALNCGQIKTGAPVRGERTSKYNRLIRIEEDLGSVATFGGVIKIS
jgi:enolase